MYFLHRTQTNSQCNIEVSGLSVYVPYIIIPYDCFVPYMTAQKGVCCDPTSAVPTKATTETLKYLAEISALGRLRNLPARFLKKPRGSSVTYNAYIFACWYSSILKRKWKQYVFYFSHTCHCRFHLKSDDGYSFCTFNFPFNLSNAVR